MGDTFGLSTWEPEWEEWVQDNQGYREPVLGAASLLFFKQGFSNFRLVFNPFRFSRAGIMNMLQDQAHLVPVPTWKWHQAAGHSCTSRAPLLDHFLQGFIEVKFSQINKSIGNKQPSILVFSVNSLILFQWRLITKPNKLTSEHWYVQLDTLRS